MISTRPISVRILPGLLLAATFLAASVAFSQDSTTPPPPTLTYDQALQQASNAEQQYANGYATIGYSPAILTIPNRPFTATRVYTEWARGGSQDTPVVSTTVTIARDAAGRIHYESSRVAGDVAVMISDPVQHMNYEYEVNSASPTGMAASCTQPTMSQISQPAPAPDPSAPASTATIAPPAASTTLPTPTKVELGTQPLNGTVAYGQSRTDFVDLQPGVLTMVTVSWFSPDMGLNVRQTNDYSNQNRFSIETTNLVTGDPDPSLFALPSSYTLSGSTTSCIPTMN